FVSLFCHNSQPGNELGFRTGPTNRSIVGSDRGAAAQQLLANSLSVRVTRKSPEKTNNSYRKLLGALAKLFVPGQSITNLPSYQLTKCSQPFCFPAAAELIPKVALISSICFAWRSACLAMMISIS